MQLDKMTFYFAEINWFKIYFIKGVIQLQAHAFHQNLNLKLLCNKILNKAYTEVSGYSSVLVSLEEYYLQHMGRSIDIFM